MNRLIDKGLVSEVILENEKHYKAVNPNRLLGLIKDKETHLSEVLPQMNQFFTRIGTKEQAYVYKDSKDFETICKI